MSIILFFSVLLNQNTAYFHETSNCDLVLTQISLHIFNRTCFDHLLRLFSKVINKSTDCSLLKFSASIFFFYVSCYITLDSNNCWHPGNEVKRWIAFIKPNESVKELTYFIDHTVPFLHGIGFCVTCYQHSNHYVLSISDISWKFHLYDPRHIDTESACL